MRKCADMKNKVPQQFTFSCLTFTWSSKVASFARMINKFQNDKLETNPISEEYSLFIIKDKTLRYHAKKSDPGGKKDSIQSALF